MDDQDESRAPPLGRALNIATLGRLRICLGGQVVSAPKLRKTQALLAHLVTSPGPHDRSFLAGLLWGGQPEAEARRNLRHALNDLRRHLGPDVVAADRLAAGLDPTYPCQVDTLIFEAEIGRATAWQRAGDCAAAAAHFQAAVNRYEGEFLAGFDLPGCPEFEAWITQRRAWLQERALVYARRQLALEPWWEEAHQQVMGLLALLGQRRAALAQYEACRRLLAEELDLEPLEETTALRDRICAQHTQPTCPSAPGRPGPYASMLPFVGREQ